jgi:hypothetical protein
MRQPVDLARLRAFMRALGRPLTHERDVYLVGGATAVLEGWRLATVDIDVAFVGEADDLLRATRAT